MNLDQTAESHIGHYIYYYGQNALVVNAWKYGYRLFILECKATTDNGQLDRPFIIVDKGGIERAYKTFEQCERIIIKRYGGQNDR